MSLAGLSRAVVASGAPVTADALHVQKDTARYLVEDKRADFLSVHRAARNPARPLAALNLI